MQEAKARGDADAVYAIVRSEHAHADRWIRIDGEPQPTPESMGLIRWAAGQGSLGAMHYLATDLPYIPEAESRAWGDKLIAIFKAKADKGDLDAQVFLARVLLFRLSNAGTEDERSEQGIALLRSAADKGSSLGMRELATCYAAGVGVPQSFDLGQEWFAKADAAEAKERSGGAEGLKPAKPEDH